MFYLLQDNIQTLDQVHKVFPTTSSYEVVSISNHFAGIIGEVDIIFIIIKTSGIIAMAYIDIAVGSEHVLLVCFIKVKLYISKAVVQ